MSARERYLGLDLSLSSPGLAVVELRRGKPVLLHVDTLKTSNRWSEGERFDHIAAWLACKYYEWGPFVTVAREMSVSSRNMHTARALFGVRAMSSYVFRRSGVEIVDFTPSAVKKELTGNGKAEKADVENAVRQFFPKATFRSDDESDAAAIVLTLLVREGKIIRPVPGA